MVFFLLRRFIFLVLTCLAISLIGFGLSLIAPEDPVMKRIGPDRSDPEIGGVSIDRRVYAEAAANLGMDKPLFYFSLQSAAYPDTFYRIVEPLHKELARNLVATYGGWTAISGYLSRLDNLSRQLNEVRESPAFSEVVRARGICRDLLGRFDAERYSLQLEDLRATGRSLAQEEPSLALSIEELGESYRQVREDQQPLQVLVPRLVWHGPDNRYHRWLSGYFRGDFGSSYHNAQPVARRVWSAWRWTLLINGAALLIAFGLSIPLGVWSGTHRGTAAEKTLSTSLFVLYAMPTFWVGSLCLVFLTNSSIGMDLFPVLGPVNLNPGRSWGQQVWESLHHLVLPVLCLTYPGLALIVRQVRGGMVDAFRQNYVRSALARGLPWKKVIWKHAFRNALFPLITLSASILPELLAGSVVIEVIFNIPGMGQLTVNAINQRDWPVIQAILMLGAVFTILGILIADLLYFLADPRVSFGPVRPERSKKPEDAP